MRHFKKGFTLIELMITVAIISILAVLATAAYTNYQEAALEKEAIAGLFSIASDAQRLIQDWGVEGAGGSIPARCLPTKPDDLTSSTSVEWRQDEGDDWDDWGIFLTGSQRWRYRLCFYVDDNANENYFVSANLILEAGHERIATLSSSLDKPLFDIPSLPNNAQGKITWAPKLTTSH